MSRVKQGKTPAARRRRAVGYVRISKRRDDETSTETQEERIRAHCAAQGWDLVDVIVEPGRSAFKGGWRSRVGFRKVIGIVEAGAADVVVVWKMNRAARDTGDTLELVKHLAAHGAEFASVTEAFDTSTPVGRVILTVIAALAEMESANKSENISAWQEHRRNIGATPTGPRPFGYRRERNRLIIDEAEAVVIKQVAMDLLAGESLRSVTARLNAAGWRSSRGKPFSTMAVRTLMTGPTVAGLRRVEGDGWDAKFKATDVWLPILDRETWDALRDLFRDPTRRTIGPNGNPRRWLVSGIAECERHPGVTMYCTPHLAGPRYYCRECRMSIGAVDVDALIERSLLQLLDVQTWQRLRLRGRHVDTTRFEEELLELAEMKNANDLTLAEWKLLRDGIMRRVEQATAEPMALPSVDDIRKAWPRLTIEAKRLVVTGVTESLVIRPARRGTNEFDVGRVDWVTTEM